MQTREYLRRQFRLFRLWVLAAPGDVGDPEHDDAAVEPGIDLRVLDRHERRDWICENTSEPDWPQYRKAITHEHDLVLARRGEETLGWAWIGYDSVHLAPLGRDIVLPRHTAYFYDCWVRPEQRGHGLGQALVAARCRRAREVRKSTLLTHVVEGNQASRAALEHNGFRVVGRTGFIRLPLVRLWVTQPFRGIRSLTRAGQADVVPGGVSP